VTKIVESVRAQLAGEWIPTLYLENVRSQRTRSLHLEIPKKENRPEILHTLLGIELKVGDRRFACPDLPTARYLRVFARVGCADLAVPYDITRISVIADELETAWHHMLLLLDKETRDIEASVSGRVRSALLRMLRNELDEIGPGDIMPTFDRETRQRKH
jgi:hypothetical protein